MDCKQAREFMSAAVDEELSVTEKVYFFSHMTECKECFAEYDDAKKTKMIIREKIIRFKAPQALINSIMQLNDCNTSEPEKSILYK